MLYLEWCYSNVIIFIENISYLSAKEKLAKTVALISFAADFESYNLLLTLKQFSTNFMRQPLKVVLSIEKLFCKILQNLQESTCHAVLFSVKLKVYACNVTEK